MKATKKNLFAMYTASPLMFGSLGAKILGESSNPRELKANLAYYLEKYECLAKQRDASKYFHGKLYTITQESAQRMADSVEMIISFMQWDADKITY